MELAIFSSMVLLTSLMAGSPDYEKIKTNGISQGWTLGTWVPVVSNGLGGILVGLVTKYHGAIVKSFAMIFGMVISGILQHIFFARRGGGVTNEQIAGALLGATSLYLHAKYPA
jgi:UDP-sugar transporter A1/2/3